jgi:hypothetical protein
MMEKWNDGINAKSSKLGIPGKPEKRTLTEREFGQ